MLEVRRAVEEDAPAIAALHVLTWQVAYRGLMPDELLDDLSVAQREAMWREVLTTDGGPTVYVAVAEDAIVGFCAAAASRDEDAQNGVAEIGALYVHPDAWRTGVGRALMDVTLRELQAARWHTATLWVIEGNQRARDFYGAFGFEPDGGEMIHEPSAAQHIRLRADLSA